MSAAVVFNHSNDGTVRSTTVNSMAGWYIVPATWYVRTINGQVWAAAASDFSGRNFACKMDDSGQNLAFQDPLREIM